MNKKHGLAGLPGDFLVNPDVYLYDFNFKENTARFVLMDRDCYINSPFLDTRMNRACEDVYSVNLSALMQLVESNPTITKPANYVFHHGACGSTLIARCLDIKGASLALREPIALHQLAIARRNISASSAQEIASWNRVLDLVLRFLSRTYDDHEIAMIKPSDWCNNIIPDLLGAHKDSAAILVYRDLHSFLLSTLKTQEGRNWMRQCFERALHDLSCMEQIKGINPKRLSDPEVTACVWVAEMYGFKKLLKADSLQTRSLYGDSFMNAPSKTLAAITDFFHISADKAILEGILSGPAFNSDSKISGKSFDKDAHKKRKELLAENFSDEISHGLSFKQDITQMNPIPERLPLNV